MSEKITYSYCNKLVREFEKVVKNPIKEKSSFYYTGVDLGTSCVVIAPYLMKIKDLLQGHTDMLVL